MSSFGYREAPQRHRRWQAPLGKNQWGPLDGWCLVWWLAGLSFVGPQGCVRVSAKGTERQAISALDVIYYASGGKFRVLSEQDALALKRITAYGVIL